ncbi:MAG: MFS transporter [Patescibacteria group bacterium]
MSSMKKNKSRLILYTLGFLMSLQIAIPAFVNSSFIGQYLFSENLIGLLYTIGSCGAILCVLIAPRILKKIGNYNTTVFLAIINALSLCVLAFSQKIILILFAFIVILAITAVLYFNLDIFLENNSEDKKTGNIRGLYLTITNIAWLVSPLIMGVLLTNGDYWKIYLISAGILLPVMALLFFNFRDFKDPVYKVTPFLGTFKKILARKNIYKIFMVKTFLQFFYSWMVIYTPIYLHKYIGFDWKTIGIIFTIMLLPFVIFQLPSGILADKKWGEKEILNIGIIIISCATIILSFITNANFWLWAFVLFITRVGASLVEIMSESYFFKHIDGKDADIISFFGITRPLAYLIAPVMASITLFFIDFRYIFFVLGFIVLFSLKYGLTLKDTK